MIMRPQLMTNLATYGLLGTAVAGSVLLPSNLSPQSTSASPPTITGDTTIELATVVRDFQSGHPDFQPGMTGAKGHSAGNVNPTLDASGKPSFVGFASKPVNDFNISNGATVPTVAYVPLITVIGSNMDVVYAGNTYSIPVTMQVHIGNTIVEPFGPFAKAITGNVDDNKNPRAYIHPSTVAANTAVWIEGRSWLPKNPSGSLTSDANFAPHMTYGSSPSTVQVRVLRDGDAVPNTPGFQNQASVATYLKPYVNTTTKKMSLLSNQTIFLFELYTTNLQDATADFQDLVVMVTLGQNETYLNTLDAAGKPTPATNAPKGYRVTDEWRDSKGYPIAPNLYGSAAGDVAGAKGGDSTGGIASNASFNQWYTDVMGTNLSNQVPLTLTKKNGVWEHLSNDFHPIDGAGFGNEGKEHNHYFTMNFGIDFTHHAGEHRFLEFQGDDDVWVFVNGKLALDLGGINPGVKQYLDVDRLGLADMQVHHIEFFYAQRQENTASFNLRTNLDLGEGTTQTYTLSGVGD
jgi:fibro-slime domain-containing protein